MSKASIETKLITKIIVDSSVDIVMGNRIDQTFFTGENRRIFKYIENFKLKYGEIPSEEIVNHEFPDLKLYYANEPIQYYCDKLKERKKHEKMAEALVSTASLLDEKQVKEAEKSMREVIVSLNNMESNMQALTLSTGIEERKERYEKRKTAGGILGIPTGFKHLDYLLHGMQKEQLITILAKTGVGKTFLEILIGCNALIEGFSVLQFTTEMSSEMIQDRYDAFLTSLLVSPISYSRFKAGSMTIKEENAFHRFLDHYTHEFESELFVEKIMGGVSYMDARMEALQPDIVLIDSAYLMEDERSTRSDDWLRIAHITRDTKQLTQRGRKIPIVINTQADKLTSVKTGPEIDNIGYSKAVGEDSDNVIGMFRSEEMRANNEMGLKVLKNREGITANIVCSWDFEAMEFESIYCTDNFTNEFVAQKEKKMGLI